MKRSEQLASMFKGEAVNRPAVNFYESGGFLVNPDKYNIYNSTFWRPLIDLAVNNTDIIRFFSPVSTQSDMSWEKNSNIGLRNQFLRAK
jgi:hypothetical protein